MKKASFKNALPKMWFVALFLVSCNPILNFGVIEEGVLYRSGQPDEQDLKIRVKQYKIKTIINLKKTVSSFESKFATKNGIKLFHIPMGASTPPTEEKQAQYFEIILNPKNHPIWIHCEGGADRTGIMTALYRIEFHNWPKIEAISEMLEYGHIPATHPKQTELLYNYQRHFGTYQESEKEMKNLKKYLDLLKPEIDI